VSNKKICYRKYTRETATYILSHKTLHIWMNHVTQMNESWHTYEWVMAHGHADRHKSTFTQNIPHTIDSCLIWLSHITHMYKLHHFCKCAIAHVRMSHTIHMNESFHIFQLVTYEWVLLDSDHWYEWVISRTKMSHITGRHISTFTAGDFFGEANLLQKQVC